MVNVKEELNITFMTGPMALGSMLWEVTGYNSDYTEKIAWSRGGRGEKRIF